MSDQTETTRMFNAQEALVCAMVLMSVADGPMSDAELGMMTRLVQELPVFALSTWARNRERDGHRGRLLATRTGWTGHDVIRRRCHALRETAYLLAARLRADGEATQEDCSSCRPAAGLDIDR